MNILSIVAMATNDDSDLQIGEAFPQFEQAFKDYREQKLCEQKAETFETLRIAMETESEIRQHARHSIKLAKATLAKAKAKLDDLDRARDYGQNSNNYLPWLYLVHGQSLLENLKADTEMTDQELQRLLLVPKDWTKTSGS